MARLYKIIGDRLEREEMEELAVEMGIELRPNNLKSTMARELFMGARRNLRLDVLFSEVHERIASTNIDLGENLYELIAGTFNEEEAAVLCSKLGFDQLNIGLDPDGLKGWNHDDFHKRQKAELLQQTAVEHGKYNQLLDEMVALRQMNLTPFRVSKLGKAEPQPEKKAVAAPENKGAAEPSNPTPPGAVIYQIAGDYYGGDHVRGDNVGGDLFKDINVEGNENMALAIGREGEATVTVHQPENREEILALLTLINQELASLKAEFRARDIAEAAETLDAVKEELQSEKPDAGWIARKLNNVSEIVGTVTAAARIASNIGLVIQAVQTLFG